MLMEMFQAQCSWWNNRSGTVRSDLVFYLGKTSVNLSFLGISIAGSHNASHSEELAFGTVLTGFAILAILTDRWFSRCTLLHPDGTY